MNWRRRRSLLCAALTALVGWSSGRAAARQGASVDAGPWLTTLGPGKASLRANIVRAGQPVSPPVSAESQYPELRFDGRYIHHRGGKAGALQPGPSAARVQLEVRGPGGVRLSEPLTLRVDAPLSSIAHGLDRWPSFEALAHDVGGSRRDLIGTTFELTPGLFSEGLNGRGGPGAWGAPVATVHFPCTVKAMDPTRPPVLRSVTGQRDVLQVEAQHFPAIDGEVVLQDLVLRDNRTWYDSGEAGVRVKDRFPGRNVRIERCEFVRCQNAVAGGVAGQRLQIVDCRIVDCGSGTQAHAVYVQVGRLDFHGNLVMQSAGNRLARAHLLKTRAHQSFVTGNRFELVDCPGSFLIDAPNGGELLVAGNEMRQGRLSDNRMATLLSFGSESPIHVRSTLVVRHNTMRSDFAGKTTFIAVHDLGGWPSVLEVRDNDCAAVGPSQILRRSRRTLPDSDMSAAFADNSGDAEVVPSDFAARCFSGHTRLGTGSMVTRFGHRGARP